MQSWGLLVANDLGDRLSRYIYERRLIMSELKDLFLKDRLLNAH